ncbi:MAG: hypothetical protein UU47_C0023G0006 [candidate division TM6 bacterium GW2011_GWE2_41_16]|nr:MAG: hypothetical protein UU47_C0023G0006 [candidate division TM6 bacterium GW2011_GWE2_41_16]
MKKLRYLAFGCVFYAPICFGMHGFPVLSSGLLTGNSIRYIPDTLPHAYGGAELYSRKASRAFDDQKCVLCCDSIPYIFFGKTNFLAADAFANGEVSSFLNPWPGASTLYPRARAQEQGVNLEAGFEKKPECSKWTYILHGFGTYRDVRVCEKSPKNFGPGGGSGVYGGLSATDVFKCHNNNFAYRFDMLNRLPVAATAPGNTVPFVYFHDTTFPGDPLTISNQDCTELNNNPVSIVRTQSLPSRPYGTSQTIVATLPALNASGTSGSDGVLQRFVSTQNYTPLQSNPNLSSMWIESTHDATGAPVMPARVIRDHVNDLLQDFGPSAEAIFEKAGMYLGSIHQKGFTDGYIDIGARYESSEKFTVEARAIGVIPVSCDYDPKRIFDIWLSTDHWGAGALGALHGQAGCFSGAVEAYCIYYFKAVDGALIPVAGSSVASLGYLGNIKESWTNYSLSADVGFGIQNVCNVHLFASLIGSSLPDVSLCQNTGTDALGTTTQFNLPLYTETQYWQALTVGSFIELMHKHIGGRIGFKQIISGKRVPYATDFFCALGCNF